MAKEQPNIRKLVGKIGRKAIFERLGVSKSSVSGAIVKGCFPASWYDGISELCRDAEIDCPRELFSFIGKDEAAKRQKVRAE